jgi:signal peptidase II
MSQKKALIIAAIIFAFTLILDQVTKMIVHNTFNVGESVVLTSFFNFTYVRNTGAAWGMLSGAQYILIGIGVLALIVCSFFWQRIIGKEPIFILFGGLLYAGIVGNIIDRLCHNYVIDFFDFHIGAWHYPCFNIADIAICVSVSLILVYQFYFDIKKKKKAS